MKKHLSSLLFLIAAALWGFAFTAQKQLAALPVLTTMSIRNLLAGLFALATIPLMDKIQHNGRVFLKKCKPDFTKSELLGGLACGGPLALASTVQQAGIASGTDAGKAAFISAFYVLFVPIISLLLGHRSPLGAWCGVVIALFGFYLLCLGGDLSLDPSDATVLLGALLFSVHILTIAYFSPRCDGIRLSCIQFIVAHVILTPAALMFDGLPSGSMIFNVLPSLLYFGICSGGVAYTLQVIGQRDANPTVASIILSLESVFGAIGGAALLGERMTPREYVGSLIIFIAVIISQLDLASLFKRLIHKNKTEEGRKT